MIPKNENEEVPSEFLCPITRDVMTEPVTLVQTAAVYDKQAIEEWFGRGKRTCPLTGVALADLKTIPNRPLGEAIGRWCGSNPTALATFKVYRRQMTLQNEPESPAPTGCWFWLFSRRSSGKARSEAPVLRNQSSLKMVTKVSETVWEGNIERLRGLVANGVSVNGLDESGRSPLHCGALSGNPVMVEELIVLGADVNGKDRSFCTPLHYAAQHNQIAVARLLLSKNAEVNERTIHGYTPLHKAAYWGRKHMIELLLKSGADRNAMNTDKQRPVDLASKDNVEIFRMGSHP